MIVFVLLVILEAALVVWTLKGKRVKRDYLQNRLVIRTAEIIVFFFGMLLPGNKLDFRFTAVLVVLLVLWIFALIRWLLKRASMEGQLHIATIVAKGFLGVLLFAVALVPAFLFTGYEGLETSGSYGVKMAEDIWVDESRAEEFEQDGSKREVPVHFHYPDIDGDVKDGVFPLVIFSHGAFGYYQSNTSTYMELASRGYVVVSLDHPYHSIFTKDTSGKLIYMEPSA